jgi:hypothetical protein
MSECIPAPAGPCCTSAGNVVDGKAHVADEGEVATVAWCDRAGPVAEVPYPLFGPVQEHLDANLNPAREDHLDGGPSRDFWRQGLRSRACRLFTDCSHTR